MRKSVWICCVLSLAGFVLAACGPVDYRQPVGVSFVYDGDSIKLANGERVRLIGIDCPEASDNDKLLRDARRSGRDAREIMELGRLSSEFTRRLLKGRRVIVQFDVEQRDKYGRLLAYVFLPAGGDLPATDPALWIPDPQSGEQLYFVNAAIIAAGYSSPMTIPPNVRYADLFQRLYHQARENRAGLWGQVEGEL